MKFNNIKSIALIALVIVAFSACGGKKSSADEKKAELEKVRKEISALQLKEKELITAIGDNGENKNIKLVEIETIATSEFTSDLKVEGNIDADQSTIATAKMPGTVIAVNTDVGNNVIKGQVLAQLDNSSALKGNLELEQQVAFSKTVFVYQERV